MDENSKDSPSDKPNFGIRRISKIGYAKTLSEDEKGKSNDLYYCYTGPKIVKVEFTIHTTFLLFSDGKVMAKGKDFGIKKEQKGKKVKDFEELKFRFNDRDMLVTIVSISAGEEHVMALDIEKNVWGFGSNKNKQINPLADEHFYKNFVRLDYLKHNELKIAQVFCLQNSTMFIYSKNIIKMIGSTNEGYLGDNNPKFVDGKSKIVFEFNLLNTFIARDLQKNELNITDYFINSKKIFNTKFALILMENFLKSQQVDSLIKTRNELKNEIENRQKKSMKLQLNVKNESKEVNLLVNLTKKYEEKINKITTKKDELRKSLVFKDNEINQKNIDYNQNNIEIERVEENIEDLFNDLSDLNNKKLEKRMNTKYEKETNKNNKETKKIDPVTHKYDTEENQEEGNQDNLNENDGDEIKYDIEKDILEKRTNIDNLKINKESLITNLQILIVDIEKKEKEKYNIIQNINDLTKGENEILRNRIILEDMIQLLIDNPGLSLHKKEEVKHKYHDLFYFFDEIEENSLLNISVTKPYMVLEDILKYSNKKLKEIQIHVEHSRSSLSDAMKIELDSIYKMIDLKIDLELEKNYFIQHLYLLFLNLDEEIKKNEREKMKDSNKKMPHSEIIYKNIITTLLKPMKKDSLDNLSKEKEDRIDLEKNDYKALKRRNYEDLVRKSYYSPEKKFKIDVSKSSVKFSYEDQISTYKWVK